MRLELEAISFLISLTVPRTWLEAFGNVAPFGAISVRSQHALCSAEGLRTAHHQGNNSLENMLEFSALTGARES
jgi:hypothetical protein